MMKPIKTCYFILIFSIVGFMASAQVKPIASGNEKFLGCCYSNAQATGFAALWDQITPENGGKWGSVEGTRNSMNWWEMDAASNLAKQYKMKFKQHTMLWGSQQPSWIGALDTTSQRLEIEQWYAAVAQRYPNLELIDVVNEPMHNGPNGMIPWGSSTPNVDYAKALGGAGTSGWDWIIKAFRMARKYFPNAKLILNEYSVINNAAETQKCIQIVNLLKAENLIDGIGEQGHAFTTAGTSTATLKANLDALWATGIPIYITEMDVDGATDLAQLQEMQRVFGLMWTHPGVKGITMWGFRSGMWRTDQKAYLVTSTGKDRPAFTWIKAFVNDTLVTANSISIVLPTTKPDTISLGTPLTLQAKFQPENATIKNVTWTAAPASIASIDETGKLSAIRTGKVKVTVTAWDGNVTASKVITIVSSTGVADKIRQDNIKIYPNPASEGNFKISGIEGIRQLAVFDMVGKKIVEYKNLNQNEVAIRMTVPKGVYTVNLYDDKQQVIRKKITIN